MFPQQIVRTRRLDVFITCIVSVVKVSSALQFGLCEHRHDFDIERGDDVVYFHKQCHDELIFVVGFLVSNDDQELLQLVEQIVEVEVDPGVNVFFLELVYFEGFEVPLEFLRGLEREIDEVFAVQHADHGVDIHVLG